LLLGDVIEEIGALDIPLGEITSDAAGRAAWALIDRVQPEVLVLAPATAERFLATAPARTRPWWQGIIWLQADPATTHPTLPTATGFTGWQHRWLAVAEATSFVAGACVAGSLHTDDELLVEVVDDTTGAILPSEQDGVIVVTPLGVDTA